MYALRYLVPALDALLTMKLNWAHLTTFPIPVMEALRGVQTMLDTLPVGDPGEPNPNVTWRPGRMYFPPPDRTLKFLEPPGSGRDLDETIAAIREMIDIAGVPSVFRGIGGARQAGYAINQLMAAAQLTYKQLGKALEHAEEQVVKLLLHMVVHTIGHEVYVMGEEGDQKHWFGVRPSGRLTEEVAPITLLGPPQSTFRPVLPSDEQADAMIGMQALNAPRQVLSQETVLSRYYGSEDPEAEMDRIATEKALEDPGLNEEMMAEAKRQAGLPRIRQAGSPPVSVPEVGGIPQPNDVSNAGEPTIPGLTQLLRPREPATPAISGVGIGGRPEGAFPGRPQER
jgi:hypothetical protein